MNTEDHTQGFTATPGINTSGKQQIAHKQLNSCKKLKIIRLKNNNSKHLPTYGFTEESSNPKTFPAPSKTPVYQQ
ncbi:hypothetical protein DN748_18210 [Sinomicrobium soli]|nr:hypothetical protein DN748_18210 [Sinomicrobium sp. N-1-3-6]